MFYAVAMLASIALVLVNAFCVAAEFGDQVYTVRRAIWKRSGYAVKHPPESDSAAWPFPLPR